MDPFAAPVATDVLPASLRLVGPDELAPAVDPAPERELVAFFVPLRPRTKGSLKPVAVTNKAGKLQRIFMKEQIEAGPIWRDRCATEAQAAIGDRIGFPYEGDVSVTCVFRFQRRPGDDRPRPTSRYYGDLDKLMRNAWDALTDAQVIKDDSLVADPGDTCKEFTDEGEPVGAWIRVVAL